MTRLLRTIRLDASDTVVFARAAAPGEWAVPGTFLFWGRPAESLSRKEAIAFRTGFLGVESFGHSTLVAVQEATGAEHAQAVERLAAALVAQMGAPSIEVARVAAREELALSESLAEDHPLNTLIALHRRHDGADIREQFRTLRPRERTAFGAEYLQGHERAFHIVEEDEVDLFALHAGRERE